MLLVDKKVKAWVLIVTVLIASLVFSSVSIVNAAVQATYYVDPVNGNDSNSGLSTTTAFRTIIGARDQVRTINSSMSGDIVIYLMNGVYRQGSTITYGSTDSGTNGYNIIYRAYTGATPVISGGVDLSGGWSLHDSSKNIYIKTGVSGSFRQLYVENKWGIRARQPNLTDNNTGAGYYSSASPFTVNTSEIGSWALNGGCEFVWINHWSQYRARIDSYVPNGSTSTIYLKSPENGLSVNHHNQGTNYYYFENAYELLDAEGEWFLDTSAQTLYYIPRSGENMSTVSVIAPSVEKLVSFEGISGTPVHNIQFYGITFEHDNWTAPNQYGYVDVQGGFEIQTIAGSSTMSLSDPARYTPASGMVCLKYANNIRLERNVFTFGGSWGVMERDGCNNNTYIGNKFEKLALGAIVLGVTNDNYVQWAAYPDPYPIPYDQPVGTASYDVISNNLIDNTGYYYKDAAGIMLLKIKNVTVEHNEIRNLPYTGISFGYEWNDSGQQDSHDNIIRYNRIHKCMQLLDDGGGIYSLGRMDNSTIEHNYLYNIVNSPYNGGAANAGLYLDNGSCYKTVQYNVVDVAPILTCAINAPNHDNIGQYNYYNSSNAGYINGYSSWINNTSYIGTVWPSVALDIMNEAGIESSYMDIGDITLGANTAIAGTASASSSYDSAAYPAAKGNDNNSESGLWASDATEQNPWWQVDLGNAGKIYEVSILARQDMDQSASRKNFAIRVSNDSSFSTYTELDSVGDIVAFPDKGLYSIAVNNSNTFRYVRIQRINNAGHFTFAECRVFSGSPILTNLALAGNGGTAASSSELTLYGGYPTSKLNDDGIIGYWNDATPNGFPDWCEINWSTARTINKVILRLPVMPGHTLGQRTMGSLTLQYKDSNGIYQDIQTVTNWIVPETDDGTQKKAFEFSPVTTGAIRVMFSSGNIDGWSFMEEIRAYGN